MDKFDRYLDELRSQLKGFDEAEQDEILEEIESHIEAGVEDSRFTSRPTDLMDEMGPPTELARQLRRVHNRRRWIEALLILVPFLIIEFGLDVALKIGYAFNPNLSETFLARLSLAYGTIFLSISLGAIWLSWRKQFVVLGLWFLSKNMAAFWLPFLTTPFMAKFLVDSNRSLDLQDWALRIILSLLWGWMIWRLRHDGLSLALGLLPLSLAVVTQGFSIVLLNSSINFMLDEQYRANEALVRFLMWVTVPAVYFLLRQYWQRWLGMGTAVYLYLFVVTYMALNLPGVSALSGPIYYVAVSWTVVIFTFGVGLLLDRFNSPVPRQGLTA